MSRPIKFRCWDKDLKQFRHIDHIIFDWDGNPWRIFVNAPNEVGCILFMKKWKPCSACALDREDGREKLAAWQHRDPGDKFRLRKYVAEIKAREK
jgi:hypothetical protein